MIERTGATDIKIISFRVYSCKLLLGNPCNRIGILRALRPLFRYGDILFGNNPVLLRRTNRKNPGRIVIEPDRIDDIQEYVGIIQKREYRRFQFWNRLCAAR